MGGTSIGTDEDKSTGSTHSLTHASKYLADARFSELEKSMQKKLDALDASGKKSSQRLLSIEQQFSRIDDLDKKLAAVTDKLEIVTEHIEKSGEVQKHISTDMEEMKIQNTEQFAAMNKRLITNMENQHKMSTTMLDLHAHFEKLSAFMEDLAKKMESDRTQATTTTRREHKPPAISSDKAQRSGADVYSTSSASSDSGSSQSNAHSVDSSASSIVYCSPEKKKQRSHRKLVGNKKFHLEESDHLHLLEEHSEQADAEYRDVCTNLDTTFKLQGNRISDQQEFCLHNPLSDTGVTVSSQHTKNQQRAPLDPQYSSSLDQAGASDS
jgi:hypothetical protein